MTRKVHVRGLRRTNALLLLVPFSPSQMAFIFVFGQELIQGHGIVEGVQNGDVGNIVGLGAFAVTTLGLTAWLAVKGDDDYVKNDLERLSKER
jgi:hypothetical protein